MRADAVVFYVTTAEMDAIEAVAVAEYERWLKSEHGRALAGRPRRPDIAANVRNQPRDARGQFRAGPDVPLSLLRTRLAPFEDKKRVERHAADVATSDARQDRRAS